MVRSWTRLWRRVGCLTLIFRGGLLLRRQGLRRPVPLHASQRVKTCMPKPQPPQSGQSSAQALASCRAFRRVGACVLAVMILGAFVRITFDPRYLGKVLCVCVFWRALIMTSPSRPMVRCYYCLWCDGFFLAIYPIVLY